MFYLRYFGNAKILVFQIYRQLTIYIPQECYQEFDRKFSVIRIRGDEAAAPDRQI